MKNGIFRKAICLLLCALMTAALFGCSGSANNEATEQSTQDESNKYSFTTKHKVIIDTDTGADDSSALILAAKCPNIEILGVTVLVGNVEMEQATKNAIAALEIAGCDAPVYKGASENFRGEDINAFSVFGKDGMGEANLVHPLVEAEEEDAVDFMIKTVKENPDEVEIIALGPATNVARAIERDPETMKKVKRIWSMGTSGLGPGNATPVAEFNVYHDPDAYKVMLDSGLPVTVIGLDMCDEESEWTDEQFERLSKVNEIGHYVTVSFAKLREHYRSNGETGRVNNCDTQAMICMACDGFVTDTINCHGSCITEDGETKGEVIFYKEGHTYDVAKNDFDYNVTLVNGVNGADNFEIYLQAISD